MGRARGRFGAARFFFLVLRRTGQKLAARAKRFMELISKLKGKRTYFVVAIGVLYVGGAWLGFWEINDKVLDALGLGAIAFLRAALPKQMAVGTLTEGGGDAAAGDGRAPISNQTLKETVRIPKGSLVPLLFAVLPFLSVSLGAVFVLSGCASMDRALLERHETVTAQVVTNEVRYTNSFAEPVAAPGAQPEGVRLQPQVEPQVMLKVIVLTNTVVTTNWVTNTVFEARPEITSGLRAAETINAVANPTPYAAPIGLGLGLAGLAVGGYASLRNRQYGKAAEAIITGIERVDTNGVVKAKVAEIAKDKGVADFVDVLVKKTTG